MSDTRGRCSYCYLNPGRDQVKTCSRCRVVRYCSVECQKKAWPDHKKCCNGDVFDKVASDPDHPDQAQILDSLNRWSQEWRDAIQTWSLWALNLRNQPDDYLSKHIFAIELEWRPEGKSPKQQFRMVQGAIMTREKVLSILIEMGCPEFNINNFKTDNRGNHVVQTLIAAEGLVKFLWFDPDEDPVHANYFAEYWEEAMMGVIEKGDPSLTKDYPKTVVMNMVPGLKGIISTPKDGSGPIQYTTRDDSGAGTVTYNSSSSKKKKKKKRKTAKKD